MRKLTRRRVLAVIAAAATGPALAQFEAKPWPPGRALPPLAGTDLNGQAWNLAELKGRPVLVNFWATWCAPCKEEMPTLQTLAELEGERLVVLAVNVREQASRAARFVQSAGLTQLHVLPDPRGATARAWGVGVFPTTVLIDREGRAIRTVTGAVDWTGPEAQGWLRELRR
ncbi:TlpA disulfide reductase family protein [Ottowia sp.]|uniref:TlpA family protein disulfide reductase n=1 Tax=Ottowia sp. TaxID=1898956 RepID=UPI00262E22F8|nr:TlpA disulfide reductase family protein [Ottowia sp.]